MREELEFSRRQYALAVQTGDPADIAYRALPRRPWLLWLSLFDALHTNYRRRTALCFAGHVYWGALVQANSYLFENGSSDLPALVLCSPDPHYDYNPPELIDLASSLYDLKGQSLDDRELQKFSRVLTSETDRSPGLRLPMSLTDGRVVFLVSIMVVRKHLPARRLTNGYFPLLVDPTDFKAAMILPSRYWAPTVLADWAP